MKTLTESKNGSVQGRDALARTLYLEGRNWANEGGVYLLQAKRRLAGAKLLPVYANTAKDLEMAKKSFAKARDCYYFARSLLPSRDLFDQIELDTGALNRNLGSAKQMQKKVNVAFAYSLS